MKASKVFSLLDKYRKWLKSQDLKESTIYEYSYRIRRLVQLIGKEKITDKDVYELTNNMKYKTKHVYRTAYNKFKEFLKELEREKS